MKTQDDQQDLSITRREEQTQKNRPQWITKKCQEEKKMGSRNY